ncbi:MAG TPA: chromate transporter [Acholeplasmatales bacterium]|nr:chromate transporter [Bacillota bacterium]OHE41147.1 MAG: chromate transporter [Tenericutes bacterium GWF2_57_13]HAQ57330.1 chromate transporter [Acholeplasmatales bacterium]
MRKIHKIPDLFLTFMKIGAFTFGGGYAMIPIMQREVVDVKHWVTDEDIVKLLVISESTPGVIAVNAATYIGYHIGGFWGALSATLGVVLPSFAIITLITFFYAQFKALLWVEYAFMGLRAAVAVIILNAVFKLTKSGKKDLFSILVLCAAFLVATFTGLNAILIILFAAIAGILYGVILARRNAKGGEPRA